MSQFHRIVGAALLATAFAPLLLAGDKAVAHAPISLRRASAGLESRGDHLHGGGADYKARFDAQGFRYVPALGRAVEQEQSLGFALLGAGREHGPALALDLAAEPSAHGLEARFERGSGLLERYELGAAGVEQSFVFAQPPPGTGDLVVRGRIASTLPLAAADAHGASFGTPQTGGVRIGAVTGLDARGRSVPGALELRAGELELRLPAYFVEHASFPIVLDPLFGTSFGVSVTANDDSDPDVANEGSNNTYLVTWSREFSATSSEIRAQRVSTSGSLIGGTIFVSAGGVNTKPSVAGNTLTNQFLITWQTASNVLGPYNVICRSVDSSTGALSANTLFLASDPGNESEPAVGGEPIKLIAADQEEVLVVWSATGLGIRGAQVRIPPAAGNPSVISTFQVANNAGGFENVRPAITKICGVSGVHMVAWERRSAGLIAPSDLYARMVSRDGVLLGPEEVVANDALDERDASIDQMPTNANFVVAYERAEPDGNGHDIYARAFHPSNGVILANGPAVAIEADLGDEETDPVVCCPGAKAWIAYCDQSSFAEATIRVEAFDPAKLVQCEDVVFAQPTGIAQEPAMSHFWTTLAGSTQALLSWSLLDSAPPFTGDIQAQLLLTNAGTGSVQDLGGGCGGGGTLSALGTPDIGTGLFELVCAGIDPGAFLAILNINTPTPPLTCGACAWVPFFLQVPQPIQSPGGSAFLAPLPCDPALIGAQLDTQYTSVLTSSSPCSLFPNVSISNRLRLTIGQ